MSQLLDFTSSGIYCPIADVYIDPWKPVDKAIITHAHPDHARMGNRQYLAHKDTVPMLKHSLGEYIEVQAVDYGEVVSMNGVKISLHPSGHIVGSAQVRLEYKGEVWVVTGDFKMGEDNLTKPFEPIKCDVLVTDASFGLPLFKWKSQQEVVNDVNSWWANNSAAGITSILIGYTLGKTQRLIYNLDKSIGDIYAHGTIESVNKVLRKQGVPIPQIKKLETSADAKSKGALILALPSILQSYTLDQLQPHSVALASGWMSLRGASRIRGVDTGFVLSDHADWGQLQSAVKECGAQTIYLTSCGYSSSFSRWLKDAGYKVHEVETKFTGETNEINDLIGKPASSM